MPPRRHPGPALNSSKKNMSSKLYANLPTYRYHTFDPKSVQFTNIPLWDPKKTEGEDADPADADGADNPGEDVPAVEEPSGDGGN